MGNVPNPICPPDVMLDFRPSLTSELDNMERCVTGISCKIRLWEIHFWNFAFTKSNMATRVHEVETGRHVLPLHSLHGSPTRYVKLWVSHAPGMPGIFPLPPWVSDPDMHHGAYVTHVPWCMIGSQTSGSFEFSGRENVPGIPGTCTTRKFTNLVRGPWVPLSSYLC